MLSGIKLLDRPPAGWFALRVARIDARKQDWAIFMIDVHPDELKHCVCNTAFLYVHPRDYKPIPGRIAREAWVRVSGKYRNNEAAWEAALDFIVSSMN